MYLIRLDDACPYMDRGKWQLMEDLLDKYSIRPLVGIIPDNADPKTMIEPEDPFFWEKAHTWVQKGWNIALHGYEHLCISDEGLKGLNPFWKRSEFAGLSLDQQKLKIRKGIRILREHKFKPKYFFAPSHTFDKNTLQALREETDIRIICDTIALKPYKQDDFVYVPQILGHCVNVPICGTYTFCFHPNTMKNCDFNALDKFLSCHQSSFISFDDIDHNELDDISWVDYLAKNIFFLLREIKGLY